MLLKIVCKYCLYKSEYNVNKLNKLLIKYLGAQLKAINGKVH